MTEPVDYRDSTSLLRVFKIYAHVVLVMIFTPFETSHFLSTQLFRATVAYYSRGHGTVTRHPDDNRGVLDEVALALWCRPYQSIPSANICR